ncbi:hypothetical protein QQS21_004813 [Conoideocrella luteorostrata]|uniref:t-SNARE coiled-coil homology domain-containing protein n=1 Tax=Conoideocrella luteorostrata TaxID=1105319 RepID=A0AAJ0CQX1_9HYPO|nr:hypothetical protein QQS21_004813 [Conoideocrella luteorostrata]
MGSNVEMASLVQGAGYAGSGGGDTRKFLDEIAEIDRGIRTVSDNLEDIGKLKQRLLNGTDTSPDNTNRQLDSRLKATMTLCQSLAARIRALPPRPPQYNRQVQRCRDDLKAAIEKHKQEEADFRKRTKEQRARQYRIINKDASNEEVQAAVENTDTDQVFAQAMMRSNNQGEARAALSAVKDRHKALEQIERQMTELAQLFQDMETMVVQQDAAVMDIEQKGEEVVDNLDKGNEEVGVAVNTARKTRKKKWICLGICVAIILIIVIVVLIYIFVIRANQNNNNNNNSGGKKRDIESLTNTVVSSFLSTAGPAVNRLEARAAIDQATAEKMHQIAETRIHLPQILNN